MSAAAAAAVVAINNNRRAAEARAAEVAKCPPCWEGAHEDCIKPVEAAEGLLCCNQYAWCAADYQLPVIGPVPPVRRSRLSRRAKTGLLVGGLVVFALAVGWPMWEVHLASMWEFLRMLMGGG